jgi:hypothetical protein
MLKTQPAASASLMRCPRYCGLRAPLSKEMSYQVAAVHCARTGADLRVNSRAAADFL